MLYKKIKEIENVINVFIDNQRNKIKTKGF